MWNQASVSEAPGCMQFTDSLPLVGWQELELIRAGKLTQEEAQAVRAQFQQETAGHALSVDDFT
jgi:hypothetical protein